MMGGKEKVRVCNRSLVLKTGTERGGRVKDISNWISVKTHQLHLFTTTHRLH